MESKAELPEENKPVVSMLPDHQTKPLDLSVESWMGIWFLPSIHNYYRLPLNTTNHREYAGASGECIGRRANQFGMAWAFIKFDMSTVKNKEVQKTAWIRTCFLVDAECDHQWEKLEGTEYTSECSKCGITK